MKKNGPAKSQNVVPEPAESAPASTVPAVPRAPIDIPGLGPIRVRALQKAGLSDLKALKAARLETLTAVPGMTEIKARQIQSFLAQFPVLPDPAPPDSAATGRSKKAEQTAESRPAIDSTVIRVPEFTATASRTLGRTVNLLLCDHAPEFRGRLQREIARFANIVERLATQPPTPLSEKEQVRVVRRLNDVCGRFAEVWMREDFNKKAQAQLADDLADASDTLLAIFLAHGETQNAS